MLHVAHLLLWTPTRKQHLPGFAVESVVEAVEVDAAAFASPALSPVLSAVLSVLAGFDGLLSSPGPLVLAVTGVTTSPRASNVVTNPRIPSSLS